jgi:hypothetical protein
MIFYISGALKGSRDLNSARARYEHAARVVSNAGHEAYVPHQHTDPETAASISPLAVFLKDSGQIGHSDGVIVFLNEPSLGVGAEIAICAQASVPMLGLCEYRDDVSRFAIGLMQKAGADVVRYEDTTGLDDAIMHFLEQVKTKA